METPNPLTLRVSPLLATLCTSAPRWGANIYTYIGPMALFDVQVALCTSIHVLGHGSLRRARSPLRVCTLLACYTNWANGSLRRAGSPLHVCLAGVPISIHILGTWFSNIVHFDNLGILAQKCFASLPPCKQTQRHHNLDSLSLNGLWAPKP